MKRSSLAALFCLFFSVSSFAQEQDKEVFAKYRSTKIGIGPVEIYDSYLSPLTYKGTDIGLSYETIRKTSLWDGKVYSQSLANLNLSVSSNPTNTAKNRTVLLDYNFGLFYRFNPLNNLQLLLGSQTDFLLGGILNSRNGNNPATAKFHLGLNLSGIVSYRFKIGEQNLFLRYQLSFPFVGALFSPQYGQSYYEIGLIDSKSIFHFSSLHNYRTMKNLFSVEMPLGETIFHIAYQNRIYQTDVNDLQTKMVTNTFYVGFSKDIFSVPGSEFKKNNIKTIFGE
ncbi:MAG: DUF3316 domain-containing protein [Dysgonamonadaceae bacterium]|jgi:hypothetical protein|nr:DUF3316 domain-containing protein [Dysgonamonadaceae bacterium]